MTLEYRIIIAGETHQIRVEVSRDPESADADGLRRFVISTAYLEHFGYLPRFVLNAQE
jgi:hypothetical protein